MARAARVAEVRAEQLLTELLASQGWDVRRPPNGEMLRQHEYKDYSHLLDIFRGRSKSRGSGDGLPEAILVDRVGLQPLVVIEAKATKADLPLAIKEVTDVYGAACVAAGFTPLAVALAGTKEDDFSIRVHKWNGKKWVEVTYEGKPIGWIPNRADTENLRVPTAPNELRPSIPPTEVLAAHADEINRLLREAKIKDEFRPGIVATIMLALWQSKGNIRKEPSHILHDINQACNEAFWKAKKPKLGHSLTIDTANKDLAIKARRIVTILERLNITVLTAEHDYLGQLYETFFRYTGGNTIGQFFTPRHIATFMADLCDIQPSDVVLDPACGTGGFLIAAMSRMQREGGLTRSQVIKRVHKHLLGFDSEPQTAALCVTNMILRGDGSTGVQQDDCFSSKAFPKGTASVVLMNPPFPHRKTDRPSTDFVDRALEGLKNRGLLASIVPYSLLVNTGDWHTKVLEKNSLLGVFTLPPDLFNPYARYDTAILLLQKGIPHGSKSVFMGRVSNDGFKVKKNARIPREGSQLAKLLKAFDSKSSVPGLCTVQDISVESREWAPEAYIDDVVPSGRDFAEGFEDSIRQQAAFYIQYGHRLLGLNAEAVSNSLSGAIFAGGSKINLAEFKMAPFRVEEYFDIELGGNDEIEDLEEGATPFVSTSEFTNGITAWKDANTVFRVPSITTATDGSMCSSFVQESPFYAFYKVAVLTPKVKMPTDALYFVAYLLKREKWRYVYARKFGKGRISQTSLIAPFKNGKPDFETMAELTRCTSSYPVIREFRRLRTEIQAAEDSQDIAIAQLKLDAIEEGDETVVSGKKLAKRLAELLS